MRYNLLHTQIHVSYVLQVGLPEADSSLVILCKRKFKQFILPSFVVHPKATFNKGVKNIKLPLKYVAHKNYFWQQQKKHYILLESLLVCMSISV